MKHYHHRFPTFAVLLLGLALTAVTVGCESTPRRTPPPTMRPGAIPPPLPIKYLNELVDEASQELARKLPGLPGVQTGPKPKVLALGPVQDETFSDRSRFEAAMHSMQTKLMQNEAFAQRFVVVTSETGALDTIIGQTSGDTAAFDDPRGRGPQNNEAVRYHPDSVYVQTGRFYQMSDRAPGTWAYRLFIRIEHARSRQVVFTHEYFRELRWDGRKAIWRTVE